MIIGLNPKRLSKGIVNVEEEVQVKNSLEFRANLLRLTEVKEDYSKQKQCIKGEKVVSNLYQTLQEDQLKISKSKISIFKVKINLIIIS